MWFIAMLVSCTVPKEDLNESTRTQEGFEAHLLFIHEVWLNPENPTSLVHPDQDWHVSLFLFDDQFLD